MEEFDGSKFFLMIPTKVSRDPELLKKPKAIILFGEIYTMLNATGKFYMSNSPLCERLECKKTALKGYLNLLEEKGYIKRQVVYSDDTQKKIIGRYITIGPALGRLHDLPSVAETTYPRSPERPTLGRGNGHKYINKRYKDNISDECSKAGQRPAAPSPVNGEENIPYREIIEYLNKKTGKSFKHTGKEHRKYIKAIWDKGFRLDDFKKVVDNKCSDWLGVKSRDGQDMTKYLRPKTIFAAEHFDDYLNEKSNRRTSSSSVYDSPEYQGLFANQWQPKSDDDRPF
ncbi:conserved phage C-terminal domain-containing protein [Lactobacillus delbrueckii subsp. bulgaricus]